MAKVGYCGSCRAVVGLDDDGCCRYGHPAEVVSAVREIEAPGARAAAPLHLDPPSSPPRRWRWVAVAVGAAALALSACAVVAIVGARSLSGLASASLNAPYPPHLAKAASPERPTPEQKRWALATCAIRTAANGEDVGMLGGRYMTLANTANTRRDLEDWWGVTDRASLLRVLAWIENGGHRRGFDRLSSQVASATPAQAARFREAVAAGGEEANQIRVVQEHGQALGGKSISGWDYGRYVALCSWGFLAGYITEDEAWNHIMPAARTLQSTFTSWDDLGENYLIGREYWSKEETSVDGDLLKDVKRSLLTDPRSPWLQLPWDLDLRPAPSPV